MEKFGIEPSNKYFYNQTEINRFMITYNFQTFANEEFLEEWLLKVLIIPLNNFIMEISNQVSDPTNKIEIYDELCQKLLENAPNTFNEEKIKKICQKIATFWEMIKV